MRRTVVYRGSVFRLTSNGRYYMEDKKGPNRLLHRRTWIDAHGPIPVGFHIHHKNGDGLDNRLENLECVQGGKHQRQHMAERMARPEYRAELEGYRQAAIVAAPAWHRSAEGTAWHREHAKAMWDKAVQVECICRRCGVTFKAWMRDATLCSDRCRSAETYQRHKTERGNCAECGAIFAFNKYRKQECCGRRCANVRRARMGTK